MDASTTPFFNKSEWVVYNGTFGNYTVYVTEHAAASVYQFIETMFEVVLITTSIISILSNISLIILIKLNQTFRNQTYYWFILSLCASDLSVGLFIIPLRLSYFWEWEWIHGQAVCKIWTVFEFTHCSFSVFNLISMCIDRFEAKLSSIRPVSVYRAKFFPIALKLLPWIFVVFICIPVLITGEEAIQFSAANHCVYVLKIEYWIPSVIILYGFPLILLCIVVVVMVIFYNVKRNEWYRIEDETGCTNTSMLDLRTSTMAALVVSAVTVVLWFPLTIVFFIMVFCKYPRCRIEYWVYTGFYVLSWTSSAITPFLWLVHTEIRKSCKRIVLPLFHRFGLCQRVELDTVALDP